MPSFDEMVTDVLGHLRAYTRNQELSTHLTQPLGASDTTISVHESTIVSRGRIQIGDEIIWVDSVDRQANELSIPPYGRGMDGTSATSHDMGTRVEVQPMFPNKVIKDRINQVISSLSGQLFAVSISDVPVDPDSNQYPLDPSTRKVLSVLHGWGNGVYADSEYVRRWRFDPSNRTLSIYQGLDMDGSLTITTMRDPLALADGDDFSDSGLPESCSDLVTIGAAARLLTSVAAGQVNNRSVEANALDSRIEPSMALQQARYLQTLFQQRLQDEQLKLSDSLAIRSHYTG